MIEPLVISDPFIIGVIVIVSGIVIVFGRIDVSLGVYCAILSWAYIVVIDEISLLWFVVSTLILSAGVRAVIDVIHGKSTRLFIAGNAGILIWLILWMLWMILIFFLFPTEFADRLIRNTLLYNGLSFGAMLLFTNDIKNVKFMASAFILTSILAGIAAYWLLPAPLQLLLQDPEFRFRGLTNINYLTFAIPYSLSAIFAFVFFWNAKHLIGKLLSLIALMLSVFFLALTGARQSILGTGIAFIFMLIWIHKQERMPRWSSFAIIGLAVLLFFTLYANTALFERWMLVQSDYEIRVAFWTDGWDTFLQSPVWGNGLDYAGEFGTAHNLFIDTLAGQGFVGTGFLLGFLAFALYASRDVWTWQGGFELAVWRIGTLSAVIYILVHTFFSGSVQGAPHLFWIVALIWRLALFAHPSVSLSIPSPTHLPSETLSR